MTSSWTPRSFAASFQLLKKAKRVRLSFKENGEQDDKYLIIDTEAISYRFKAQLGDYPDYEGVMPSEFVAHASIDSGEAMRACQSLSALWLDRECPIKLSLSEGKITLQAKEDRGEAVIQADTTGQAEIAVNASFLLQGLKAMGGMTELSVKGCGVSHALLRRGLSSADYANGMD